MRDLGLKFILILFTIALASCRSGLVENGVYVNDPANPSVHHNVKLAQASFDPSQLDSYYIEFEGSLAVANQDVDIYINTHAVDLNNGYGCRFNYPHTAGGANLLVLAGGLSGNTQFPTNLETSNIDISASNTVNTYGCFYEKLQNGNERVTAYFNGEAISTSYILGSDGNDLGNAKTQIGFSFTQIDFEIDNLKIYDKVPVL